VRVPVEQKIFATRYLRRLIDQLQLKGEHELAFNDDLMPVYVLNENTEAVFPVAADGSSGLAPVGAAPAQITDPGDALQAFSVVTAPIATPILQIPNLVAFRFRIFAANATAFGAVQRWVLRNATNTGSLMLVGYTHSGVSSTNGGEFVSGWMYAGLGNPILRVENVGGAGDSEWTIVVEVIGSKRVAL
jgi:hypothetical protein